MEKIQGPNKIIKHYIFQRDSIRLQLDEKTGNCLIHNILQPIFSHVLGPSDIFLYGMLRNSKSLYTILYSVHCVVCTVNTQYSRVGSRTRVSFI